MPEPAPSLALLRSRHTSAAIAPAPLPARASGGEAPRLRAPVVPRTRLLRRLTGASDVPLAMIVAPAGYGKTTLLAEWAMRDERPFAWVSLEAHGGDTDEAVARLIGLVEDVAACDRPHVVVLDDAHLAATPRSIRRITELACRLPGGSMLALASRRRLAVPIGRLRAHHLMIDIGARDLAMTPLEAALLLEAVGVRLDGGQIDRLVQRTEGWPVGLYLAALSIDEQEDSEAAVARFGGADRFVAEYIREELLADLPIDQVAFLRGTSVLARLTPPLCDAVLETRGSAAMLHELAQGNVLIAPSDREETEFRYHPLLAQALRAELIRIDPELEPRLHRRAADWHSERGDAPAAIRHAVASRDAGHAGRLLWSLVPACVCSGRAATIGEWLAPFPARTLAGQPALALSAAMYHLAEGRREAAERAAQDAERTLRAGQGTADLAAGLTMVRACLARDGLRRMGEDAARACAEDHADSAWQSLGSYLAGVGGHLTGDRDGARALLEDAVRRAGDDGVVVDALCRAQLALLAIELGAWEAAAGHADAARASLAQMPANAPAHVLVLAIAAAVAAHRGDIDRARRDAADAHERLTTLAGFLPWYLAQAQIWLARAAIRLSDASAARALLSRAAREQSHVQDAPVLAQWLHEAWERADAFAAGATGDGPPLTNAELRVLRFLPSHLTFREIGARLHVSTNTVKTQALAVYRKLDASSRSEAVARGRSVGLIDS
jgi:LuxR family transcriptional regulator, maltose regulon positive regulatory protein